MIEYSPPRMDSGGPFPLSDTVPSCQWIVRVRLMEEGFQLLRTGAKKQILIHCTSRGKSVMKKVKEAHVPYNSGWAGELKNGQVIRIVATTTVDFVCMAHLDETLRQKLTFSNAARLYNLDWLL